MSTSDELSGQEVQERLGRSGGKLVIHCKNRVFHAYVHSAARIGASDRPSLAEAADEATRQATG